MRGSKLARKGSALKKSFTIRDLPLAERPRERLVKYGVDNLPVQELLSLLLGRGIAGESVMMTAQRLLSHFGNLEVLAGASIEELQEVKGIGLAKACQIKAAFELGRRKGDSKLPVPGKTEIKNPEDVANVVNSQLLNKKKEHFWAILLDSRGRLIRADEVSVGSLDSSIVHPREAFKEAMSASAAKIIFVHNHPSGVADPSEDDIKITKQLAEAGEKLGIEVLDHVIVGEDEPFSMKRHGLF